MPVTPCKAHNYTSVGTIFACLPEIHPSRCRKEHPWLKKHHPQAFATYKVVFGEEDAPARVEVTVPGSRPTMVSGFSSAEQAAAWIKSQEERVRSGPLITRSKFRFRGSR